MASLTAGALNAIFSGEDLENVVLQVLDILPFPVGNRYCLLLSDGFCKNGCIVLSTNLNHLLDSGQLSKNCIIKVHRYTCNQMAQQCQIMLIHGLEILLSAEDVGSVIGDPAPYVSKPAVTEGATPTTDVTSVLAAPATTLLNVTADSTAASDAVSTTSLGDCSTSPTCDAVDGGALRTSMSSTAVVGERSSDSLDLPQGFPTVIPIDSLSHRVHRWTIKARVLSKSPVYPYKNAQGPGERFFMELHDGSGQISAIAFNEHCKKFYPVFQLNRVYFISNSLVHFINEQYSRGSNKYEIKFCSRTKVVRCLDECAVPPFKFDFVPIGELHANELDEVDVLGVCSRVFEVSSVTVRRTGEQIVKRDVILMDDSDESVSEIKEHTLVGNLGWQLKPFLSWNCQEVYGKWEQKNIKLVHSLEVRASSYHVSTSSAARHRSNRLQDIINMKLVHTCMEDVAVLVAILDTA
ncbi:Replication factor-A protein 1 N-terminal [Trinorchestia longiramus]|nr:Replication factor-A protein 1 N-terminal [Trinorchestia longiramus]